MEQQKIVATKSMTKILKYLPTATSSVSFQSPSLYSPVKDKKPSERPHKSNLGIGFSGPILSTLPSDSHRKINNDSKLTLLHEPTSPRVSCVGTVKCKRYRKLTNKPTNKFSRTTSYLRKKKCWIRSLFIGGRRKCDAIDEKSKVALTGQKGPCLNTMKRFSSGRDAFMSFDWTTQVAPLDSGGRDGEEVVMPSSAPVMVRNKGVGDSFVRVGGVNIEPRKEINLWKRRTMAQPQPLQVHVAN
ncbi:hypothetical protein HanRHA438_Chr12g0549651 [Helianthus annuus]|nr:hypothetical protein HanIR_Chr12g0580251 [Helianthus annuus]KAJ0866252.1 hypothetical protein HanRHA438_Chr12g0549651 [Helianthus annuus]